MSWMRSVGKKICVCRGGEKGQTVPRRTHVWPSLASVRKQQPTTQLAVDSRFIGSKRQRR